MSSTIDLKNGFVFPPPAEAHIHELNNPTTIKERIATYLSKVISYVLVQDSLFEIGTKILTIVNPPETLDVVYAQGVVLPSWYHSVLDAIYRPLAAQGTFGGRATIEALNTHELFLIETKEDLDMKWDKLLLKNRDIIKVILVFSETYEREAADLEPPLCTPAEIPVLRRRHV